MKRTLRITLTMMLAVVFLISLSSQVFAASFAASESVQDISQYQAVIDRLNAEYGYEMRFAPELAKKGQYISPTKLTLDEFERTLRQDIEADIKENETAFEAVSKIDPDSWQEGVIKNEPLSKPNVSYYSHKADGNLDNAQDWDMPQKSETKANTIATQNPREVGSNIFVVNATIDPASYWKFSAVSDFSYTSDYYPLYVPTSVSYSRIDALRTIAATFTCKYYNANGVLVNSNSSIYREFYAGGDCVTNSPNYTIPKTYTNQGYRSFGFTSSVNCAGYAWRHNVFVGMADLGITYSQLNGCTSLSQLRTLVKNTSEAYMRTNSINFATISAYNSSISPSSQYRAVMRVGYVDSNENGRYDFSPNPGGDDWDYHWWLQLGDGQWADKRGSFPSRIIPNSYVTTNPDNLLWTMYQYGTSIYSDFYNSTPVYYKITR